MKFKKILFSFIAVAILILLNIAFFFVFTKERVLSEEVQKKAPQKLSTKNYEKIKKDLLLVTDKEDPRTAINSLKVQMENNPAVLHSCHDLLHEVGFESYKKYHDFGKAMTFKDDICVSGYMHGVIEGHFSEVKDVSTSMNTLCKEYPFDTFIAWECYHGIGHGLMYLNENNVPLALDGCKLYETNFARSACSNGVYMENFNADSVLHPSKYLNPKVPFYPCNTFDQDKGDCYMNAPIYFLSLTKNNYSQAATWCDSVESAYKYTCFYGLGSQITRRNMDKPKFVEAFCMKQSSEVTEPCIKGMTGWYISYFARLNEATSLCSNLENKNKSLCFAEVEAFRSQF